MKYVLLFTSRADDTWQRLPEDRQATIHGEIMTWWQKHEANGVIVGGERLQAGTTATTYRVGDDLSVQTIDGPYAEAKEEVSGFGLIEVESLDAALELARSWPALCVPGEGVEVRPVFEM